MYLPGKGHEHEGPGTSLVQHINWTPANGLGDCGCGKCAGIGFFDSMDFTSWSWPEWGSVGLIGYMVISTVFTTRRAVSRVREDVKRTRRKIGKRVSGN